MRTHTGEMGLQTEDWIPTRSEIHGQELAVLRCQLEDIACYLEETLRRNRDRKDSLRLEAAQLREQYAQLHKSSTNQGSRMAELVTLCDDVLRESPATWGRAHLALRDHLAQHRRYPP